MYIEKNNFQIADNIFNQKILWKFQLRIEMNFLLNKNFWIVWMKWRMILVWKQIMFIILVGKGMRVWKIWGVVCGCFNYVNGKERVQV